MSLPILGYTVRERSLRARNSSNLLGESYKWRLGIDLRSTAKRGVSFEGVVVLWFP